MESTPQMKLDLSKTISIETSTGKKVWQTGVILRKASRFLTGTAQDAIIPIDVFFDPETGEICQETLPTEIKSLFANG